MSRSVAVLGVLLAWPGCFSGSDALGLPCEQDDDCGRGQSCVDGFCGGPPDTGTTTTVGSTTTGDAASTTTTADTTSGTTMDASTGIPEGCGNGIVEGDEQCDDEGESASCNVDCTPAECGDGVVNETAGEQCDASGPDAEPFFADCTQWCMRTLFWDDMSDLASSNVLWNVALPALGDDPALPSDGEYEWAVQAGEWRSGVYSCLGGAVDLEFAEPIEIPAAPPGMHAELRFVHRHNLDPNVGEFMCTAASNDNDGGVVFVVGDATETAIPAIYNGSIQATASCDDPGEATNPLAGSQGYVGQTSGAEYEEREASLQAWEGQSVRIRFRLGYDCNNCGFDCNSGLANPPRDYGWRITNVAIAFVPD